jgi:hypothetical protein
VISLDSGEKIFHQARLIQGVEVKSVKINFLEGLNLLHCEIKSDFSLLVFGDLKPGCDILWYIDRASIGHFF